MQFGGKLLPIIIIIIIIYIFFFLFKKKITSKQLCINFMWEMDEGGRREAGRQAPKTLNNINYSNEISTSKRPFFFSKRKQNPSEYSVAWID